MPTASFWFFHFVSSCLYDSYFQAPSSPAARLTAYCTTKPLIAEPRSETQKSQSGFLSCFEIFMLCSVLSLPRHRLPICNFQENKSQCKENRQACNRHVDRSACQFYSCNNCRTEERWLLCLPTSYPFLLKVHLQEVHRTLPDGQPAYSVSANDPYIPAVPGFRFLFQICAASIPDSSLTAVFLLFLPFLSEYFYYNHDRSTFVF